MITLKNSKLLSYIFFTLVNAVIALWFLEIKIFLVRQTILTILYGSLVFFNKNKDIEKIKDDFTLVNELLLRRSSLTKYETFLTFCMLFCIVSFGNISLIEKNSFFAFMNYIAVFISIIYFILLSYRGFLILTVPEIKTVMFRSNKISLDGSKRSFSTYTFVKVCLECTRYAGSGLFVFTGTAYLVPKWFYGCQYRSPVVDFLGYYATGLKSNNEVVYGFGQEFLAEYPDEKILVTEGDGYTLSKKKLFHRAIEKKFPSLYLLTHNFKK